MVTKLVGKVVVAAMRVLLVLVLVEGGSDLPSCSGAVPLEEEEEYTPCLTQDHTGAGSSSFDATHFYQYMSLGWPLSYLNLQIPMKIGGFGDRGSPHPLKVCLGGLKRANHSLGCLLIGLKFGHLHMLLSHPQLIPWPKSSPYRTIILVLVAIFLFNVFLKLS